MLPFDLSYEFDVWGRVRRTIAASREEAQATAADLETVSLSLHAELAFDYFELRSSDVHDTVKAYQESLQLTTDRFDGGAAPKSDVAQAQTQLETTRVQDTDIGVQRAQFEHAIAVLIGKPPAAFSLPPHRFARSLRMFRRDCPHSFWSGGQILHRPSVAWLKPTSKLELPVPHSFRQLY